MNTFPMRIFLDTETILMTQCIAASNTSIDIGKLLSAMKDISSDFIQSVEVGEPRMMLPISDPDTKRLIIEETNRHSVSPEKYIKAAVSFLHSVSG
ncbi:hypothetical protein OM341_19620 [Escherichia albertii]|nr:hypothetical protein [Escherichia albertii]